MPKGAVSMSEHINHTHIDRDAILNAIGESYGQEWFFLMKCPKCDEIYLYDREIDIIYFDATNLSTLHSTGNSPFICKVCNYAPNKNDRPFSFEVTLAEVNVSSWSWVIKTKE